MKKYLVTWFDNAWHNGTFYGRKKTNLKRQIFMLIKMDEFARNKGIMLIVEEQ